TTTTTDVESSSFRDKPATNIKEKKISSSKSKRRCIFNQQWLKDPKYAPFLRECRANKYFAHCSISRSICDFIPPSSALTKLTAAELSLVYHGIFNESEIGQNISCGKTKARELSVNVL
ncbi:unnamed protein product, partial [Rotaria magnacalcarata]